MQNGNFAYVVCIIIHIIISHELIEKKQKF